MGNTHVDDDLGREPDAFSDNEISIIWSAVMTLIAVLNLYMS